MKLKAVMIIFLNIFTIHANKTNPNKSQKGTYIDGRDLTPAEETKTTVGSRKSGKTNTI